MSNEDFILNRNAFADKGVRRYFAARSDLCADLNFNECTDSCLIADDTAIKINEVGMKNPHLFPQLNVRRLSASNTLNQPSDRLANRSAFFSEMQLRQFIPLRLTHRNQWMRQDYQSARDLCNPLILDIRATETRYQLLQRTGRPVPADEIEKSSNRVNTTENHRQCPKRSRQ